MRGADRCFVWHREAMAITDGAQDRALQRLVIVEAIVIALDRREQVLSIVSSATDDTQAKAQLANTFDLSEVHAIAVLDLQVRRFTQEDRRRIVDERDAIRAQVGL